MSGLVAVVATFSIASAMEMTTASGDAMKKDTIAGEHMMKTSDVGSGAGTMKKNKAMMKEDSKMMPGTMKVGTMMKKDSAMMIDTAYEKMSKMSSRKDITKLQMMLVEKKYLVMPQGAVYGSYGEKTKMAHAKYKSSMMMKDDNMMKKDGSMKEDGMMKK